MVILPDTKPLTAFEEQIVAYYDHRMPGRNAYFAASYAAMRLALAELERDSGGRIAALDATDVYVATPEPAYSDHCHLTPLGRKLLARAIAVRLIEALDTEVAHQSADQSTAVSLRAQM